MKRSGLENNVLKKNAETNQIAHRKQRNYCVSLFRKEKKKFLESLDIITNSFGKTMKPFFCSYSKQHHKITL